MTQTNKRKTERVDTEICEALTQPSCTFSVASSLSLWTNSLLPVKKKEKYANCKRTPGFLAFTVSVSITVV